MIVTVRVVAAVEAGVEKMVEVVAARGTQDVTTTTTTIVSMEAMVAMTTMTIVVVLNGVNEGLLSDMKAAARMMMVVMMMMVMMMMMRAVNALVDAIAW